MSSQPTDALAAVRLEANDHHDEPSTPRKEDPYPTNFPASTTAPPKMKTLYDAATKCVSIHRKVL
jgi:hypothetical protein